MKVYGIAENKCKEEVYTKNDIIKLNFQFGVGQGELDPIVYNYPKGFTINNSVILSVKWAMSTSTPDFTEYHWVDATIKNDGRVYITPSVLSMRVGGVDKLEVRMPIVKGAMRAVQIYLMKVDDFE